VTDQCSEVPWMPLRTWDTTKYPPYLNPPNKEAAGTGLKKFYIIISAESYNMEVAKNTIRNGGKQVCRKANEKLFTSVVCFRPPF